MKHIITANQKLIEELQKETSCVIVSGETAKRLLLTMTNDYKTFTCGNAEGLIAGSKPHRINKFVDYINLQPDQSIVAEKVEKAGVLEGEVWKITINNKLSFYWFY